MVERFAGHFSLIIVLCVAVLALPARLVEAEELVVPNFSANSVTVYQYPKTGTGTVDLGAPRVLQGPATGLNGPASVAVDAERNELIVLNYSGNSITVYPRTATGNTPPLRTLQGPSTGLNGPNGLILDTTHNELIVVNFLNDSVTAYDRTASGNASTKRPPLQGNLTGLSGPAGLAFVPPFDQILVANANGNSIVTHDRVASGNAGPARVLVGNLTGLSSPRAMVVDGETLYVVNLAGNSVVAHGRTASGNSGPTGECGSHPGHFSPNRVQQAAVLAPKARRPRCPRW